MELLLTIVKVTFTVKTEISKFLALGLTERLTSDVLIYLNKTLSLTEKYLHSN